jgi:hypothetical protein
VFNATVIIIVQNDGEFEMPANTRVHLTLTLEQAEVLSRACETYVDLGLGHIAVIAKMVRDKVIPIKGSDFDIFEDCDMPSPSLVCGISQKCADIHSALGYDKGESLGLGSQNVHNSVHSAYEIFKVLVSGIQQFKYPDKQNVHTSGLTVRYTQDSKPECVIGEAKSMAVETFSGSGKTTDIRKSLAQWVETRKHVNP